MRPCRVRVYCFTAVLALGLTGFAAAQPDTSGNSPATNASTDTPSLLTNSVPAGPVVSPPLNPAPPPPADTTTPAPTPFSPSSKIPSSPNLPDVTPSTGAATAPGAKAASGPGQEIDDIRPPFFYIRSWFWLWIALAAIALIALIVYLIIRFRPNRQLSPKSAYELALEKLEQARALLEVSNPEPYAVFVSETIRSYLGQRFQSPSTRRTTDEFLRLMDNDPATPLAAHRDLLREFLQSCDLVKFARYQPELNELEQVQQRAYTFVTATWPVAATGHANGK